MTVNAVLFSYSASDNEALQRHLSWRPWPLV